MFNFDNAYQIFARHPALAEDPSFLTWFQKYGLGSWSEGQLDGKNERTVIVISSDGFNAYAARVKQQFDEDLKSETLLISGCVIASSTFDLLTAGATKTDALRLALVSTSSTSSEVIDVSPEVEFKEGKITKLYWLVKIGKSSDIITLNIENGKITSSKKQAALPPPPKTSNPIFILNEWLATNELHSPYLFKQEADSWTAGPLTVREKALRICNHVRQLYGYNSNIPNITEFTWRDTLTRDTNGRQGICDEWAVVQISYLRAIGIQSRLKFLIWTDSAGQGVGHACLEFYDGSRWTHMDALWSAFDYPARYRVSGAQRLTVMDADYPQDSRSSIPAWGKPDPTGDGRLYPYGDFLISPAYPGSARPGYSY